MGLLLTRILDHDLHRVKSGVEAVPLMIETPAKPNFVPALVSTCDAGRFLVSRRLTKDGRIRSAVFKQNPDKLDDLVNPIVSAAYKMSVEENYPNRFDNPARAFDYIAKAAGTGAHPHIILVPPGWLGDDVDAFFGNDNLSMSNGSIYRKICRIVPASVDFPVFLSRPDFVGLFTQFLGGFSSIVLHNVRNGMAFVQLKPAKNASGRNKKIA